MLLNYSSSLVWYFFPLYRIIFSNRSKAHGMLMAKDRVYGIPSHINIQVYINLFFFGCQKVYKNHSTQFVSKWNKSFDVYPEMARVFSEKWRGIYTFRHVDFFFFILFDKNDYLGIFIHFHNLQWHKIWSSTVINAFFSRTTEKIQDHSNGDVATDSYHLYKVIGIA